METKEYFHESCVFFLNEEHQEEILQHMSTELEAQSLVEDSFGAAIMEREKEFPTGLSTEYIGVALPHTDSHHVITPFISVGILEKPVSFQLMGAKDVEVEVNTIFMLGIKESAAQLEILQQLMEMIQDEKLSHQLKTIETKEDVVTLLKNYTSSSI